MDKPTDRHLRLVHSTEDDTPDATDRICESYTEFTTKDITLEMIFDSLRKRGRVQIMEETLYEITGIIIREDGRESDFRVILKEERKRAEAEGIRSKFANMGKATRAVIVLALAGVGYGTYIMASNLSEPATVDKPDKPIPQAFSFTTPNANRTPDESLEDKSKTSSDETSSYDDELLESMLSFEDDYQTF